MDSPGALDLEDLERRLTVTEEKLSAALFAARGATVHGIDISPDLIAQSQKLWPEYADRLHFRVGDAENLDLPDNSVDACFFGGVLHHFQEREQVCA